MNNLLLSSEQEQKLVSIEEASFLRLCKLIGCDPRRRQSILLEEMKNELHTYLSSFPSTDEGLPEFMRPLVNGVTEATSFWNALHLVSRIDKESILEDILQAVPQLSINFSYLSTLANTLGIEPPRPSDPDSLRNLLSSIPHLNLFDLEFNAFVGGVSQIGQVPCVCVYSQLLAAVKGFSDVITPLILSYRADGSADPASADLIISRAQDHSFQEACKSCFEMIFCETDSCFTTDPKSLMSRQTKQGLIHHTLVYSGAQDFAWYHEYGHLCMGHLAIGPCHRVEYEADLFSSLMIAYTYTSVPNASSWRALGSVILLLLLMILEQKNPKGSVSHSPASYRLTEFFNFPGEPTTTTLQRLANAVINACNPVLSRWWNFEVSL